MKDLLIPILRTGTSFIILMFVTFFIGKHINSHKNHYSFALSVTIGSFIANMGFDTSIKFKEMLASFLSLVLMYYLFMVVSSRSRRIRKWVSGKPTVLIEKGKLLDENMKKAKFSLDDLNQLLREQGIFNIYELEYVLLEVSGELSILKKQPYQNPVKQDFNMAHSSVSLPIELIMDGEIIEKNTAGKYNREWLEVECQKRNLQIDEIYYAVINSNGTLFIDKYEDQLSSTTTLSK
ncbi:DUF421 domain-containing protein [Bacillus sp. MRMR6]|uniref:DUF421 domain-containing protein n=1 Tax=Bacillus sp. MRMR6 TaxID=1928617 RepID=UPI0009535FB9|nr:DUF421 domain-containing protein [Bacillus sp. MRMR6]OLS39199.1 DUF421 domain-containing protein [Bacillus sp. MRMR6]